MTTTRRLTARQLATALAEIDAQLAQLVAIEGMFRSSFATASIRLGGTADAWNATHDAIRELEEHRAEVAANPRPIAPAERGTWELVQQNID
jgi:hypothetical protein